VVERADGLHALRTHVVPGPAERRVGELEHRVVAEAPFVAGTPLSEVLATAPAQAVPGLLRTWREHVEIGASAGGPIALDPAPGNVLRDAAGGLVDVDEEWFHHAAGVREVLERSLLHEAMALADARPPETWPDLVTVGDLLRRLADEAGLGPVDEEALARREGAVQAEVGGVDAEVARADVHAMLERPLRLGPLGIREHELRAELERRLIVQDARVQELHDAAHERLLALEEAAAERTALEAELAELRAAHAQVVGSRSWRATEGLRRFAARLRR
jgi:hypothetical protein